MSETDRSRHDPNLAEALKHLSSDVIEYAEARYRLIQAEMKVSIGRFGGAAILGGIGAFFLITGYLPIVFVQVLYLSSTWFGGNYIVPLSIVASAHFLVAFVFIVGAWQRWKVVQKKNIEEVAMPLEVSRVEQLSNKIY